MEGTRRENGKPPIPKDGDRKYAINPKENARKTRNKTDGHIRVIRGKYTNADRPLSDDFCIEVKYSLDARARKDVMRTLE